MESIEKLQKWANSLYSGIAGEPRATANRLTDEIKAEIAEKYMLLPVDADGVPIRVGEIVQSDVFGMVEVDGFVHGAVAFWSYDPQPARIATCPANLCRHVKPRTLEDVLCDALSDVSCMGDGVVRHFDQEEPYVQDLADEIRKILGVDE